MNTILDSLPVGTLITLAAIVGGIIALIDGAIDYQELLIGIGAAKRTETARRRRICMGTTVGG